MNLDPRRVLAARVVAVTADALQIGLFPLFIQGALSTVNDAVDVLVAAILLFLVGWHWTFLPAFVAEMVPGLDLAPTWTAAVFFATRKSGEQPVPPTVVVEERSLPPAGGLPSKEP